MPKINVLPENVANQIAAGEVVVRPASCVKELLENSLDAGAKNISVMIEDAGRKLIEVKDDGTGMDETDAENAFQRHATSKINSIRDLDVIETLGFRGEALASIASVARVELITRSQDDEAGVLIAIEGGTVRKKEKTAANKGTSIRVRDLFYNTPARYKFMKSDHTEEARIIETVMAQGLSRKNVSIRLAIDGREALFFPPDSGMKERVRSVYGREVSDSLVEISAFTDSIKITGFVCKPNVTKNNRSAQHMFVNGRAISSRNLSYAVYEGYGTLLMRGNYPVTFIFLDITPSLVDVNVHPTKAEVKFRNEKIVFNLIKQAVENALGSADLSRSAFPRYDGAGSFGVFGGGEYKKMAEASVNEFFANESGALFEGAKVDMGSVSKGVQVNSERRNFLSFRALGQVNKTYIVGEDENGLVIIDQHAAHEKILYEEIMRDINSGKLMIQEMLIPEVIEVTPAEKNIVSDNMEVFGKIGFRLELFGENAFGVQAHPVIVKNKAIGPVVRDMIGSLVEKGKADADEVLRDLAATVACRAAVKAGDDLRMEEMESLLNEYFEIDAPFSCPHGRPPIVKIDFTEIEKMFKRKL
jgi:DNA mismatch repair protein MutL